MPQGRYTIGAKGTYGCSGYPVVGDSGKVHGCHETRAAAEAQQAAIYTSESEKVNKSMYSVVENSPMCNGQFAVVDEDGEVEGCFSTRAEAESMASMKNEQDSMDDMDEDIDDMGMSKSIWAGTAFTPVNTFTKRDYSADQRRRMAERGQAMPDGSFPIANETDLRNAIQSVGRASNYEAAKRHIMRRARALGLTRLLPEDWK